jgi:amidase
MDNANFPGLNEWRASTNSNTVLEIDFEYDVANYFKSLLVNPTNITTLSQLINFTHTDPREDWPDRNTITWEQALALNLTQTSANYTKALFADLRLGSNATIAGAINMYGLDALILPTSMAAGVAAIAGYPVVTVPLGYVISCPSDVDSILRIRRW